MIVPTHDPVGEPGLPEDISQGYEQSASILQRAHTAFQEATLKKRTYESVYRDHAVSLRKLIDANAPETEAAQGLLRRITLQQTLPWNELETPDYEDSYTKVELTGEEEPDGKFSPVEPAREWQHYINHRKPYATEQENLAFIAANTEWAGKEEDEQIWPLDDREYVPEYLTIEGQPDQDFDYVFSKTMLIDDKKVFLATLQELADEGTNPANLARVYLWRMDYLKLSPIHAETIRLRDPVDHHLRAWINTMWEHLFEYIEACGSVDQDVMTPAEIDYEVERLFKQYVENMDDSSQHPQRQKDWVVGYIYAINAGLPIRRIKDNYTASDAAWDAWRTAKSSNGQEAYQKRLSQGASRREAMRSFYRIAYRDGVLKPGRPKSIKSIRKFGLILTNEKFVNWSVCVKIDNEEGFDLSQERRAELKSILLEKGWGGSFTAAL